MSTHPNAILLLTLKPDDLSRKTYRKLLESEGLTDSENSITIGKISYNHKIMETDYCKDWQISADEGDIIIFDMVTYGYGANIEWSVLEQQKNELEEWAKAKCEQLSCTYKIQVTANYW